MLANGDRRLQEALQIGEPFGGLSIVAMGDMFRILPVMGEALYTAALYQSTNSPDRQRGGELFQKFRLHRFTTQRRCDDL